MNFVCRLLLIAASALPVHAQITADNSLGTSVGGGPNFTITGGTPAGNNLFHSFSQFNVNTGQSAAFTGSGNIRNVLARVTGGTASQINGALRCDIAGANLFLVNPAGVVFGPGASLDVSGNFAASTAHFVTLADGGRFDALNPNQSSLTAADPASFGFLGNTTRQPLTVTTAVLSSNSGGEIVLAGGDIDLSNGFVQGLPGSVGLVAVGPSTNNTRVPATLATLGNSNVPYAGRIGIANASRVRVSGDPANRVVIRAGRLVVEQSSIDALAGNADGGNIDIIAERVIVRDQGLISVSAPAASTGDAGRIDIVVRDQLLVTNTSDAAKGNSSQVTGIAAQSQPGATGSAGSINVDAAGGSVVLTNEGVLSSTSFTPGAGGDVNVTARRVLIDGEGTRPTFFTGILARTKSSSAGGRVEVAADTIDITRGGRIATSTINLGRAGRLDLRARTITVDRGGRIESTSVADPDPLQPNDPRGRAGRLNVTASESLVLDTRGAVSVETDVEGDGGAIRLEAPQVVIRNNAQVTSRSTGDGSAGRIAIVSANRIDVTDATVSASSSFRESGDITLQATREIALFNSSITNRAFSGDGGNINLFALDKISIIDSRIIGRAGLQGGQITIDPKVVLLQNSLINGKSDTSNELGAERDVLVTIVADNFIQSQDSVILTERQQFEPTQVAGQIVRVSSPLGGNAIRLDDACALLNLEQVSTLTQLGRGGTAPHWATPLSPRP